MLSLDLNNSLWAIQHVCRKRNSRAILYYFADQYCLFDGCKWRLALDVEQRWIWGFAELSCKIHKAIGVSMILL
jgi:hypothetical protein